MKTLVVSSSPHITSNRTTKGIMLDVVIALVPAMIAALFLYGFYSWFLIALSVGSCVLAEFLFNKITKSEQTISDCSAVVTGVILALNLPPVVPFFVPIVGGFFAIMLVKMLFGGIGKNFANPAMTARIFLLLAWTSWMTKFVPPIDLSKGFGEMWKYFQCIFGNTDMIVTGATPMAGLFPSPNEFNPAYAESVLANTNVLDMFLGRTGGSMGEVSALALLIGGVYLIIRRVIDWKIPTIYIGSVAIFTFFVQLGRCQGDAALAAAYILPSIFGGGLMLGAFFMATDYASSPNTKAGVIIYALGLGLLTTLFRVYGSMPEGVSFAILFMNVVTPLLDKFIKPRPFGYVKPVKEKKSKKAETAKEGK